MPTRIHGVLVLHGQGKDRKRDGFLVEVTGGIADTLEDQGAAVSRSFDGTGAISTATLVAVPPPPPLAFDGAQQPVPDTHILHFVDVFWDDAFPPPRGDMIYRWAIGHLWHQTWRTLAMLKDPGNDHRGVPESERQARAADRARSGKAADTNERLGGEAVPLPIRFLHAISVGALFLLIVVGALAGYLLMPVFYLLSVLSSTPGIRLFGFWKIVEKALHTLDPFATQVMGDSQRYVEDGMWSASARNRLEAAMRHLRDGHTDLQDVTIIAHSAGAGVAYDALLDRSPVVDLVPIDRASGERIPLALVTCGGAVNRYFWLASKARIRFARRFADRPLDPRLREDFHWLDLYSRFDYVASGRICRELIDVSGIDEGAISTRQVVNLDNPIEDHFAYFGNRSLAVSRILRTINGGERFWPDASATAADRAKQIPPQSWEFYGARRRLRMLGFLQLVRLIVGAGIVTHLGLLAFSEAWRDRVRNALLWMNEGISRVFEEFPPLDEAWEGDLETTLGKVAAVLLPIVILLAAEKALSRSVFDDLDLGRPRDTKVAVVGGIAAALILGLSAFALLIADEPPDDEDDLSAAAPEAPPYTFIL